MMVTAAVMLVLAVVRLVLIAVLLVTAAVMLVLAVVRLALVTVLLYIGCLSVSARSLSAGTYFYSGINCCSAATYCNCYSDINCCLLVLTAVLPNTTFCFAGIGSYSAGTV
jgi:hypothetical protein